MGRITGRWSYVLCSRPFNGMSRFRLLVNLARWYIWLHSAHLLSLSSTRFFSSQVAFVYHFKHFFAGNSIEWHIFLNYLIGNISHTRTNSLKFWPKLFQKIASFFQVDKVTFIDTDSMTSPATIRSAYPASVTRTTVTVAGPPRWGGMSAFMREISMAWCWSN